MATNQQPRLGRGLSSLISTQQPSSLEGIPPHGFSTTIQAAPDSAATAEPRAATIPINKIRANPQQPRKDFEETALNALAESIKKRGTLQPILVRPSGAGFELIAGERRLRAATIAGIKQIPAIIRSTNDDELLELALIENIQRSDLNPIEKAKAFKAMATRHNLTQEQIAERTGEDRATIANQIRLLSLCEEAQELLSKGLISTGHAKALLSVSDIKTQLSIISRVVKDGWSVRQVEAAAAKAKAPASPAEQPQSRPAVRDVADKLSRLLGVRVQIHEGRRRHTGRLTLEYHSLDDFERITSLLGFKGETA